MQLGKYALLLALSLLPAAVFSQAQTSAAATSSQQNSTVIASMQVSVSSNVAGQATRLHVSYQPPSNPASQKSGQSLRIVVPPGFDISRVRAGSPANKSSDQVYYVQRVDIGNRAIELRLSPQEVSEAGGSAAVQSFDIDGIVNPTTAGSYNLSANSYDSATGTIRGRLFDPILIAPAALDSIAVTPNNDTTVRAGNTIDFSATGYDEFGNPISGLTFRWTLEACTNCIGFFTDSTLTATKVGTGTVVALSGGISGRSGLITVVAGDLERMVLNIADTQFVATPLRAAASIILYDHYNNLMKDYDLAANPITLVSSEGELTPSVLNSNSLQIGGVVRLLLANVRYLGLTAASDIYATNGAITSNTITVHFNGYDIKDALDISGRTVSSVTAGHLVTVKVPVQNSGNLIPAVPVVLTCQYVSGEGGTTQTELPGNADGLIDTLSLQLPVHITYPATDTIVFSLSSQFVAGGQPYSVTDSLRLEIAVSGPAVLNVAEGTLKPDTILSGHGFNISLDIAKQDFDGPIDSVHLAIQLAHDSGGVPFATLFDGSPEYSDLTPETVSYRDLASIYTDDTLSAPTTYALKVTYHVISNGNLYVLENEYPDSLVVIPAVSFSYVSGSFSPSTVFAGTDSEFSFDLDLQSTVPLYYCPSSTDFSLSGDAFNISTILQTTDDTFVPGTNVLRSISVFVPENQSGKSLSVAASVHYCVPGVPDTLLFTVPFDTVGLPVQVVEHPVVRILSLEVVAPNAPRVNTSQPFQLLCTLENISSTPIDSLTVRLSTDGNSSFDPDMVVRDLGAHDTSEVYFDVTAATEPQQAEVFRTEVVSSDVGQSPPVDNIAFITIETPADLNLSYSLLGAGTSVIDYGSAFELSVVLANSGQAAITDGTYRIIEAGFDKDGPDTLTGTISADKPVSFSFISPNYDTTLSLEFTLTSVPNDVNIGDRPSIEDTSFNVSIRVISSEGQLVVNARPVGSTLILPGRSQEIFDLELTNSGASPLSDIVVNTIEILARDGRGVPVDVRSIVNIGNTGFFENGIKVAMTTASDNRLVFTFDHFQLNAGRSRTLNFVAELKDTKVETLKLELAKDQINATFIAGPNAGQSPEIASDQPGSSIMQEALAIKGAGLESSFLVKTNPFDPSDPSQTPLEFSYELPSDATVEFRIFTLTGEKVYAKDYTSGSEGGRAGENFVYWDGRNEEGVTVFNGVYIVSVRNADTDEHARLKLAVVK